MRIRASLSCLLLCLSALACGSVPGDRVVAEGRIIHRFFDTCPVSPSGKYIALFRLPYENKTPLPGDCGDVTVIRLSDGKEVYSVPTRGWEVQMGANVQWGKTDHDLFYNDVDTLTWDAFAIHDDFLKGEKSRLEGTVFMVSPDGSKLASYDLKKSRFAQVGYGVMVPDSVTHRNIGPTAEDGIYVTDVATGKCRCVRIVQCPIKMTE